MPDDRFKKYQEAGVDFLETARARAEEFLQELSKAGESTQRQGRDAIDDLVGGGRKGTEQMISSIRKEIRSQLSLLGLATKEDLAALERRLGGSRTAAKSAPAKKAASTKAASTRKAPARKAAAKKSSGASTTAASKTSASKGAASSKSTAQRSTAAKKSTRRA